LIRLGYVPANSKWADQIAFSSDRDGNQEVYVMNVDGSNPVNLTNHPATDYVPDWSPDGTKIAFASTRDDGNWEVYVMNADGSHPVNLTNNPAEDFSPVWSPDGTKIAFCSGRDGNYEVHVMNADGSHPVNLTNNPAQDVGEAWSPNGAQIAFSSLRDGNWEVYVMNADGSHPVNLTHNTATDYGLSWSPDGTRIAFSGTRDGNWEVYVMNANGSNPVRLTNNPASDWYPEWSPEGTKIAFVSDRDGNQEVYAMNADGSSPLNLTNHPNLDYMLDWSPVRDGRRWLVGENGTDWGGYDPPFGTETDGAILVWRERGYVDAVDVDALTPKSLKIQGMAQGAGEEMVVAEVAADQILQVREDRGPGSPPLVLIGPASSDPVYAYGPAVVKALLSFSARTGRVVAVLPLSNRSRAAGLEYTVERAGDQLVLRGDFAAVVEAAAAANRAPDGAAEVVLDAATGEVVTIR
jgi:Tol biopolymer transport system component